uniref:Protein IQ-DOMAIN 31 n=1 Tax=Triticum urartu TaxID=4572 RepID=A0A8R7V2K6_TRIUA
MRALKAVVNLQALVRGYLVRKQAAATLRSMQALVRAQASTVANASLPQLQHSSFRPHRSLVGHQLNYSVYFFDSVCQRTPSVINGDGSMKSGEQMERSMEQEQEHRIMRKQHETQVELIDPLC